MTYGGAHHEWCCCGARSSRRYTLKLFNATCGLNMTSPHCARHKIKENVGKICLRVKLAVDILESEIFNNHHAGKTHAHAH